MTMIVPMILERIRAHMQRTLIDEVSDLDELQLDQVKVGRYQQNPSTALYRMSIIHGDIDDQSNLDGIHQNRTINNRHLAFDTPPREMGGGGTEVWWRRGILYIELFFVSQTLSEDDAREVAYGILGRAQDEIQQVDLSDTLRDDHGEVALMILSTGSNMIQSGGPPSSWIFRGKVYWDCMTSRESKIGMPQEL